MTVESKIFSRIRNQVQVMDEEQVNFEWSLTPHNASMESKTGITFTGKDTEYINAHGKLLEMFKTKGESFLINSVEIRISDTPKTNH